MNSAQKIDKSIQKMMTLGRRLGILFTALFITAAISVPALKKTRGK